MSEAALVMKHRILLYETKLSKNNEAETGKK